MNIEAGQSTCVENGHGRDKFTRRGAWACWLGEQASHYRVASLSHGPCDEQSSPDRPGVTRATGTIQHVSPVISHGALDRRLVFGIVVENRIRLGRQHGQAKQNDDEGTQE